MGPFRLPAVLVMLGASMTMLPLAPAEESPAAVRYEYGPDSTRQDDAPRGEITQFVWNDSKIYPGTIRRYWIYVPAQYDDAHDAALMVFQDGHAYVRERGEFRTPIVLDNLIHQGDMPVTIGVFVDPGHTTPELPPKPNWEPKAGN